MRDYICAKCGKHQAEWASKVFIAPLCTECANQEALRLGKKHGSPLIETEDYYIRITDADEEFIMSTFPKENKRWVDRSAEEDK